MPATRLRTRKKHKQSKGANKRWRPPDYSPRGLARMMAKMSKLQISKYNAVVAKIRLEKLRELRMLLRQSEALGS